MPAAHDGAMGTCGLVAMTSASHAEGRQLDPGQVYIRTDARICKATVWQLLRHSTHGLVAMTSASHPEGRQLDPGWVYF